MTDAELIDIGRGLIDAWDRTSASVVTVKAERMENMGHAPVVHGLAAHAHRLGAVALDLFEQSLALEAITDPCGLRVRAHRSVGGAEQRGHAAFYNEDVRRRGRLSDEMQRTASQVFRDGADNIAKLDFETLPTSAAGQARNFTHDARAREQRARQERRRVTWKGPRRDQPSEGGQ